MDKNMISIDDLVRDRLSGGEENERTGAWLQMRDLLDKKMPVETTPVAFGWKRITGYIAGVVLLAALSVGGYKTVITHGNRQADNAADNTTASSGDQNTTAQTNGGNLATTTHVTDGTGGISGNPNKTTLDNYGQDNNTVRPANNNRNNNNNNTNRNGSNRNHTAAAGHPNNSTGNNLAANSVHNTGNPIEKSEHNAGSTGTENNAADNTAANTGSRSHTPAFANNISGNHAAPATIGAPVNSNERNNTGTTHSVQPRNPEVAQRRHNGNTNPGGASAANTNSGNSTATAAVNSNVPAITNIADAAHKPGNNTPVGTTTGTGNSNNVATTPALRKDTIEKIRLVQHYNRRRNAGSELFRMDTIGVEQMIINLPAERAATTANNTPSLNTTRKAKAAQKNPAPFTMTPTASASAAKANTRLEADANSNLVPLSNYKVASRKVTWDPQRFEEAVSRFKYKLAQLKFYPGMVAGINASMFGPNSFGGFQLGLSSTVAFNDRLSLAAELKYISRFNSGVSVTDDYAGSPTDSNAIYNAQGTALEFESYTRDSVHHYFNFSMLHSIELPVSIKYSIGRFFLMGGINLAYHLKVDAEEVERHLTTQTVVPYYHAPITWPEGKPSISNKDFNSRFEFGGLFGVGYEMTPAVQLDLRMTKSFLDNARTSGARTVSDQLYKSPSVQLSIGYRFSQQQKH